MPRSRLAVGRAPWHPAAVRTLRGDTQHAVPPGRGTHGTPNPWHRARSGITVGLQLLFPLRIPSPGTGWGVRSYGAWWMGFVRVSLQRWGEALINRKVSL